MDPPLPENAIGNLLWFLPVVIEESEMDLAIIVHKMKKLVNEFVNEKAMKFKDDVLSVIGEFSKWSDFKEMELYNCSISWCKFPLYETDFGWGKPIWVSSASLSFKNSIILVDTRLGDGIEAWVTLEEENMSTFERDEELLDSASFNPSALVSDMIQ
ncbi:Transferase [Trema orientale]|uniref:Transferase n=1 Tax=Trema orientale TaxID=63057 RepID=A0A2P5DEB6_TREOI|nr:Transferase [Trema orientale]